MSLSVETQDTARGAESGPPAAISSKSVPAELHIGPLPQPGLFERLRTNWSLAALVPEFDLKDLRKREWRSAGVVALVLHAAMIAGIIVIGKYALATFTEQPSPESVTMLNSGDLEERPETPKPDAPASEPGRAADGPETSAGGAPSGGGGADTRPATGGNPPAMAPKPPMVLPPPPAAALLPITNTVQGPEIPVPQTAGPTGLPDVPPPDGPPSPGTGGDGGVGDGPGGGIGDRRGNGPGGNGHDVGPGTRPGGDGIGAGDSLQGPLVPTPNMPNRGPRFIRRVKPRLTKAMLDNNTFGTVTLRVTVGYDGSIQKVEPVQTLGDGGTEAAIAALRKCTFSPAIRNQHYVTESIIVRFDFTSTAED